MILFIYILELELRCFCWFLWSARLFVQGRWCAGEMEFSGRGDAAGSCIIKEGFVFGFLVFWLAPGWGIGGPLFIHFCSGLTWPVVTGCGASAFVLFLLSGYPTYLP